MIDELCKDCQDLIGDYPLVKMVNTVRSNLYNTLREVDKMLAIPEKVLISPQSYLCSCLIELIGCFN